MSVYCKRHILAEIFRLNKESICHDKNNEGFSGIAVNPVESS